MKDVALTNVTWKDKLFRAERAKSGEVMKCCVFDEAVIPLKEIVHRMKQDGYQGIFALEYSHPEKYPADFPMNTQQMKKHMVFFG